LEVLGSEFSAASGRERPVKLKKKLMNIESSRGLKVKNDLFAYSLEKGFGIELFADIQTG
jgi:uncharacterized protein YxjI